MSVEMHEQQRIYLDAVTAWAERCHQFLEPLARRSAGRVHFRPSSRGVSMVGLLPSRPQRGRSGFRDLNRLRHDFESLFDQHCVQTPQGRPTPEKRLQSWMTADAYRHDRQMSALDTALGDSVTTLFIADELVLPTGERQRMVCDVLALRKTGSGRHIPVIMELKSARQMKRLIEQVNHYAEAMDRQSEAFQALYSAILGDTVTFTDPPEKWIVWPLSGQTVDPRTTELAAHGIRIVGFEEVEGGFRFRVGPKP